MSRAALRLVSSVIAAVTVTVVLSACGGSSKDGEPGRFASLGCAACHTLKAADATGRTGPDLDELKPDAETVARQMRNGGNGMPSFKHRLSDAELRSLAAWVAKSAQGG